MKKFDVEFLNPKNNPGTLAAFLAEDEEDAKTRAPIALAASSQWHPEEFTILAVKPSTLDWTSS